MRGHTTLQGGITVTLAPDVNGIAGRRQYATSHGSGAYPDGQNTINHRFQKNDILLCPKKATGAAANNGGKYRTPAFASLNGLPFPPSRSVEDLADEYYFGGVNLTDFDPTDPTAPQNGLAAVQAGTVEPHYSGTGPIYAGDDIIWSPPDPNDPIPQWDGKPRNKIPPSLERLDFRKLEGVTKSMVEYALRVKGDGVGKLALWKRQDKTLTNAQQAAMLLKRHVILSALKAVKPLLDLGLITILTPEFRRSIETVMQQQQAPRPTAPQLNVGAAAPAPVITPEYLARVMHGLPMMDLVEKTHPGQASPLNAFDTNPTLDADTMRVESLSHHGVDPAKVQEYNERSFLWLAAALEGVSSPHVPVSRSVQNELIKSAYPLETLDLTKIPYASAFPHLHGAVNSGAGLGVGLESLNRLSKEYMKRANGDQTCFSVSMAEARYRILRRRIGTSLETVEDAHMKPYLTMMLGSNTTNAV